MERKAFEAELASLGFDEVLTRDWPPNHFMLPSQPSSSWPG